MSRCVNLVYRAQVDERQSACFGKVADGVLYVNLFVAEVALQIG